MKSMKISLLIIAIFSAQLFSQSNALIWYPGGKAQTSAQALQAALQANGTSANLSQNLLTNPLNTFTYIFICLGVYPNNYVLKSDQDSDEIEELILYLDNGGKIYMEGGDTWAWDFPTDLHPKFKINGNSDGEGDLQNVIGLACFAGLELVYGGTQQYIDRISPQDGAYLYFQNSSPSYGCGVGFDNGTYRTLGVSYQFGGLTDGATTKNNVMSDILDFFDNGCSTAKNPAPRNLQAFSGYNNAVPLVWDAPVGQAPLNFSPNENSGQIIYSTSQNGWTSQSPSVGRQRESTNLQVFAAAPSIAQSVQTLSYNIYKSLYIEGPYSRIASNVQRQFYRDESASIGNTYFYKVAAVYSDGEGEGEWSFPDSGTPADGGFMLFSPWSLVNPHVDGVIENDEWQHSYSKIITVSGQPLPVTLFVFNNDDYLYLAIDDQNNTSLDTDDQIGIYFDKDMNYNWPLTDLSSEGNFWIFYSGSTLNNLFRGLAGWWPQDILWSDPANESYIVSAVSMASGHAQYEMSVNLNNSKLTAEPADLLGFYLYSFNRPDSVVTGSWPETLAETNWNDSWLLPSLYGSLRIGHHPACPSTYDTESVNSTGIYTFNEFGDGHAVELDVTSLTGSGSVQVEQHNCAFPNLPCADELPLYWLFNVPESITGITAHISCSYTSSDAAGFPQNKAYWGIARLNENALAWQWMGGVIDAIHKKVTIENINSFGYFVLFRRIFGDSNGDGYVDSADLQQFGDTWHDTASNEFPEGTSANFHNYNKSTDNNGKQIIDSGDLQIFGDTWHNGIKP